MTMVEVRLLTKDDAQMFYALRMRAVKEEADSFLETDDEVAAKPAETYFENGWIAGGFTDGELVGIAGLYRNKGKKLQHRGSIWGVYVIPQARGKGFARGMIELLLEAAKTAGLERILLSANAEHPETQRMYQHLGFEPYGVEKQLMKRADGSYVDDVLMAKVIK